MTVISIPGLWVPKRRRLLEYLGRLRLKSTGLLMGGCCCQTGFTPGDDCANCDASTSPASFDVTVTSAITMCTCSDPVAGDILDTAPTGTVNVPQTSSCDWGVITGSVNRTVCAGGGSSEQWVYSVTIDAGSGSNNIKYTVQISSTWSTTIAFNGIMETPNEDQDCSATRTLSNLNTSSSDCSSNIKGYGGTVRIKAA